MMGTNNLLRFFTLVCVLLSASINLMTIALNRRNLKRLKRLEEQLERWKEFSVFSAMAEDWNDPSMDIYNKQELPHGD